MCEESDSLQPQLIFSEFEDVLSGEDMGNLKSEYLAAKLATERERCKFLEIRVQRARGELISAEEVEKSMFAKGRIIRDSVLNIPDRVAPLLINKANPGEIHDILMNELREVLKELSRNEQEH